MTEIDPETLKRGQDQQRAAKRWLAARRRPEQIVGLVLLACVVGFFYFTAKYRETRLSLREVCEHLNDHVAQLNDRGNLQLDLDYAVGGCVEAEAWPDK